MRTALCMLILQALAACNFEAGGLRPDSARRPAGSADRSNKPAARTSAPETDANPVQDERGQEAIMIQEPGPGSRLTSPLRVLGMADPTFEQALVARLVDAGGAVLAEEPLTIRSPLGERGPFEAEIEFAVTGDVNAQLQVYETSARDGGIAHLASAGITLLSGGAQEITRRAPHPEQIIILAPENGQQVGSGVVHVEGSAVASFEGTLVIELYDAEGAQLGSEPIIVDAPGMGQAGDFEIDIAYTITQPGPARLVVRDPIPVADGVNHIASVEVQLLP